MSTSAGSEPLAAFNNVLNEVLDVVQDVKQAHRKVPETEALHAELDRLFRDLGAWAQQLVEEDQVLGVSPLSQVRSAAGRVPPNLWTGAPADDEVRRTLTDHLERLEAGLVAARAQPPDGRARAVLDTIYEALTAHLEALRA